MNKKEVIQEKNKNNWELAKSLGTLGTVSLAGSVAAGIKYVESGNSVIAYIALLGFAFGIAGVIFLGITYRNNLRLINKGKEV